MVYRWLHQDGKIVWTLGEVIPILGENGKASMYIGTLTDITAQKQAEIDRENLHTQLIQSQKMEALGQLSGGLAHDFNNVLSGILSASQLLRQPKQGLNDKSLKYVDMITKSAIRASDLIRKLLTFSRKGKIVTSIINIHEILDEVVAILEGTIDKKIPISVVKDAQNQKILGDFSTIESSFLNLGINASHAMPNGGLLQIKTKNIFLDQKYCDASTFEIIPGEFVQIEVKDTGCGIPEENLQKIFEPFFTTKDQGKGTGLGLSAVYGTVQDHHGIINVHSDEGVGTTFSILLPCAQKSTEQFKEPGFILKGNGTVLLVDDERNRSEL